MLKRRSSLLLPVTSFLLLSSAACSSGAGSVQSPPAADSGKAAQPAAAPAAAPKITIYQNGGSNLGARPEGSTPDALSAMKKLYKDKLNIDADAIVPPQGADAAKQKLNLMLGSSENLDIFQGNWDDYASKGAILPLNDLLDKYGQDIKKAWSEDAWANMKDNKGNIWGIPRAVPTVAYPVWVRSDWMKKLNQPMPKTLDEFEKVMQAFKDNDPDGNGKADTIPLMTDLLGLRYAFTGGFVDGGYGNWLDPADNKIKPVELAPGYKDFVVKMADWYQKGFIYKEAFGKFDPMELLKTGRVGASSAWYSRVTIMWPQVQSNFPGADYDIVRNMTGPKGKIQTINAGSTSAVLITKKSKNPEAAMKFINYQYQDNPANAITAKFGANWKYTDAQKFNVQLLDKDVLYAGEYAVSLGLATETKYVIESPTGAKHANYLNKEILQLDTAKEPIDLNIVYNKDEMTKNIPNINDLTRLRDEETVKFITGARPIADWDKFIDQLNKAGLDKWIDEYTRQYKQLKK
ncbi:extracellular solute-binding protein [Paenibacillus thalictri]|uniref:Extracellular solute-binding protein n=1 Tax=Paenibacillus thalictri TaxID=2527873 RepID=A0A4Q9DVG9_9BACL|nr:extracellular solute-binding protein [Paenibacillus thalictri]TBL78981.1 extracellular solute-binding protein [Paenibacillus thalictri]